MREVRSEMRRDSVDETSERDEISDEIDETDVHLRGGREVRVSVSADPKG